ncbi:B22R family protein, partial [Monkeypox virus]
MNFQKLSLAIY